MLLYVGRIRSEKNISFLLEVFSLLLKEMEDCHLVMVGSGSGLASAKGQRAELGLEGRVHFPGYIEDRELLCSHYQSANLFLFASLTETQGLVLLESFAAGTPAVAIDAPGVRDIMGTTGTGGYLVPEERESFKDKIVTLLQDRNLLKEKAAEARQVAQNFSASAMARRLLKFYQEVSS